MPNQYHEMNSSQLLTALKGLVSPFQDGVLKEVLWTKAGGDGGAQPALLNKTLVTGLLKEEGLTADHKDKILQYLMEGRQNNNLAFDLSIVKQAVASIKANKAREGQEEVDRCVVGIVTRSLAVLTQEELEAGVGSKVLALANGCQGYDACETQLKEAEEVHIPGALSMHQAINSINACLENLQAAVGMLGGKYNTAAKWVKHYTDKERPKGKLFNRPEQGAVIDADYLKGKLVDAIKKAVPQNVREQVTVNDDIEAAAAHIVAAREQKQAVARG